MSMGKDNVYIGFEDRVENGLLSVIFPEYVPDARVIYFPKGTYLVSDTVSYTIKNLKNIRLGEPFYEIPRGIHILGEVFEETVIKLCDNSIGFEADKRKPVVSYINGDTFETNVAQLNTMANITVDCGQGNPGAVGVRFESNNSGKVENIKIISSHSKIGLHVADGTDSVMRNIMIDGFNIGIYAKDVSVTIMDDIKIGKVFDVPVVTGNSRMVFKAIVSDVKPVYSFLDGYGVYTIFGNEMPSDEKRNAVYYIDDDGCVFKNGKYLNHKIEKFDDTIPEFELELTADNCVYVEEFGAKGDGKTDCTQAIQSAMNSGKPIVLFGGGHYFVNGNITIPKSVQLVDCIFSDFFAGDKLISGECEALFTVDEDSKQILHIRNIYTFEQFYGHCRLVCHNAVRDLVLKDVHTQTMAMYFNKISGSNVYLDDTASTTGTYSMDCIIARKGFEPEYCHMIPCEFHGQKVIAYNLNHERADVEVLNDSSDLLVFGLKVEGPGTALKSMNGNTNVFICSCGIGKTDADNGLFEVINSDFLLLGSRIGGVSEDKNYNRILKLSSSECHSNSSDRYIRVGF